MTGKAMWVGTDGNRWISDNGNVWNAGPASGAGGDYWAQQGFTMVLDPNAGASGTTDWAASNANWIGEPTGPTNAINTAGAGAGSGSAYTDTSAARGATQSSIDSLDSILGNKNAQADGDYAALVAQYGAEEADNMTNYTKQTEGNEGNRESQQQAALLAAANGGRGLNSVLASIGALGGTGKLLANRAVSNEANLDIGNANKTFDTNATNLFDSYGALKKQEEQRRLDAKNILDKTKQQNQYDVTQTRQGLFKDMADLWTKAGNNGEAANALGRASALNAELVANTRPNVGEYAKKPLQYQAPALNSYLAGANDMTVNTSAGGLPINGAIYTSTKKRDKTL